MDWCSNGIVPLEVGSFSIDLSSMAWGCPTILVKLKGRKKISFGQRGLATILMGASIVNN